MSNAQLPRQFVINAIAAILSFVAIVFLALDDFGRYWIVILGMAGIFAGNALLTVLKIIDWRASKAIE